MRLRAVEILVPLLAAAAMAAAVAWWRWPSGAALAPRLPQADEIATPAANAPPDVKPTVTRGPGSPAPDLTGQWPGFRGAQLDGASHETVALAGRWPDQGPKVLWRVPMGEGYAGAAVRDGRVYVMDYDPKAVGDALRCLSLADGREIWRLAYPVKTTRNHGMSRTVPAVSDKYVVALGPKCHLVCVDARSGELKWSLNLVRQYGTTVPLWYAGQCPVIDGDAVVIAPAGPSALMLKIDLATGKVLWTAPNPRGWRMTHSSIAVLQLDGKRMYAYCGSGGVAVVDAASGQLVADTDAWKINMATVPTPVVLGEGRLFCSGGYDAGSVMLQLFEQGKGLGLRMQYRLNARQFGATQQTPVYHKGYLYGIGPDGQLVCLDQKGATRWASGGESFGLGPLLIADDKILAMNDDGGLTMARATPEGFQPLASAKILRGPEAWGPMALAGGLLIARDLNEMVCLDLRGAIDVAPVEAK